MKKSRIFSTVIAALMLCTACVSFTGCESQKKTLIMATNAEFPPYEYYEGDKVVGIDAEIAAAIAALQSGKADIGAAGMTVSEDRLKSIDFSDPYTTASQVIIVKNDSVVATPDDLVGKHVGVQLGTTGDIYSEDIEDVTIERYNKGFEAVQALLQDKIDAVIIDREPAKVYISQNEGLKILDESFTDEEYAIAVAKGNEELLNKVNESIKRLKDSGELQAIIDKYISAE